MFQQRALPLIREESFAPLYCEDNGRPNQPVQVVFGVLLLKEIFNLTDAEALEQLEFNLLWQHALAVPVDEAHLCQKTLHNFRTRLLRRDPVRLVFEETTDRIIAAMGVQVERQRLDHRRLFRGVPVGLRGRYLQEDGAATSFGDVRRDRARRRLGVCARDVYRLREQFAGTAAASMDEYRLLERLLSEQCEITTAVVAPDNDDDDMADGGCPVVLKEPQEVAGSSLQTPHDPDVTYSGHKGKGYEVQIAETCTEGNAVELITHVEVTAASGSDASATLPALQTLWERDLQPQEFVADTAYGSAENALAAESLGTELVSPVAGNGKDQEEVDLSDVNRALTAADFTVEVSAEPVVICPAGHAAVEQFKPDGKRDRIGLVFAAGRCETCSLYERCPARRDDAVGGYVLVIDLAARNLERRRRQEASGEFAKRYAIRAGIEATNSELKRKHGLGKLRVRGRKRVELAVCLKALACNLKRMIRAIEAAMATIPPSTGPGGGLHAALRSLQWFSGRLLELIAYWVKTGFPLEAQPRWPGCRG